MFQPSTFVLPENPIVRAYDSCGGLGNVPTGTPRGLGVHFPFDMNSVVLKGGLNGLGACCSACEHGLPCSGGLSGLSDTISNLTDDTLASLNQPSPVLGLPWLYVLGGAAVLFLLFGTRVNGSDYKYEKMTARREYDQKLRDLKNEYPTRGRHAYQHAKAGYDRLF